ncbi:MAG: CDP-alcohol phosphatidyltransferase family protein, partial [Flavobacteriaceae bacterium]|nr:CDP-alcohol phosphatidyltransferase family protein [Flavobacteriaceae bacterium]
KHIPNLFTFLNLSAGLVGILFALENQLTAAAMMVLLGIFFDFFDGFFARILKVTSELGKQLDSLADIVTSGVVPGLIIFQLLKQSAVSWGGNDVLSMLQVGNYLPFIGLMIPLASAYRLANFNIDERQTSSFVGLPTPANALLIVSIPLIIVYSQNGEIVELIQRPFFLVGITIVGTYLLNAKIPLFALKFKNYQFKENVIKYLFLLLIIVLVSWLQFIAIPIIIIIYVLLSLIENLFLKVK